MSGYIPKLSELLGQLESQPSSYLKTKGLQPAQDVTYGPPKRVDALISKKHFYMEYTPTGRNIDGAIRTDEKWVFECTIVEEEMQGTIPVVYLDIGTIGRVITRKTTLQEKTVYEPKPTKLRFFLADLSRKNFNELEDLGLVILAPRVDDAVPKPYGTLKNNNVFYMQYQLTEQNRIDKTRRTYLGDLDVYSYGFECTIVDKYLDYYEETIIVAVGQAGLFECFNMTLASLQLFDKRVAAAAGAGAGAARICPSAAFTMAQITSREMCGGNRKAYLQAVLKLHPDKNTDCEDTANEKFKVCNNTYAALHSTGGRRFTLQYARSCSRHRSLFFNYKQSRRRAKRSRSRSRR
jgi:hypothetical protein